MQYEIDRDKLNTRIQNYAQKSSIFTSAYNKNVS